MKFTATLQLNGKTATGIAVPPEVVEGLGPSRRPAVRVTINGFVYRSTVAAGDHVAVDLELDTEPREVHVPADLAEALAGDAAARPAFEALSYSGRQRIVLSVEGARTTEARRRRIAKALGELSS